MQRVKDFIELCGTDNAQKRIEIENAKVQILQDKKKEWNIKNREKQKEYHRIWALNNKDKIKAWRDKNKELIASYRRSPEAVIAKALHAKNNAKKYIEACTLKRQENRIEYRKKANIHSKVRYSKHSERILFLQREQSKNLSDNYVKSVMAHKSSSTPILRHLITSELIELKRIILKTERLCSQLKK